MDVKRHNIVLRFRINNDGSYGNIRGRKRGKRGVWGRINDFVKCQNLTYE
jgi:hypothetical protein